MIVEKIVEQKRSKIQQWPVKSNRASILGHECLRYLVFERVKSKEKVLHDVRTQFIFDEGNLHEQAVIREIMDAGFQIIEQQRAFEWPEYNITGHIDFKVMQNGHAIPVEIKSCHQAAFDAFHDVNSLYNHKWPHVRRYPAQMTLYLLMDAKEWGLIIFKNKQSGELKEVRVDLDYELGETLIRKAERINRYVDAYNDNPNTWSPPHLIQYDDNCENCGYEHICLPEVKREALDLSTDPQLEADLNRREELKPLVAEYNKLDKRVKKAVQNHENVMAGDYLITGKLCQRKAYTVNASEYWKINIKKIDPNF